MIEKISENVVAICSKLVAAKIYPMAVGGAVRDLLLGKNEIKDWDFEVRSELNQAQLEETLIATLGSEVQSLGFGVYRMVLSDDTHLEFSLPRLESFKVEAKDSKKNPLAHRDIEFELDPTLSPLESFARRDLTINAIGLEFDGLSWNLVDPLGGEKDLKARVARPCSKNFSLDPVRFLRALRFHLYFDLEVSNELKHALKQSNLSLASDHYILYEAGKVGFFPFMREFFSWVKAYDVEIPESWQEQSYLSENTLPALEQGHEQWLLHACWLGEWGLSAMGRLERFLKMRRGRAKHYLHAKEFFDFIADISWAEKVNQWQQSSWERVRTDEDFVRLLECHKHWATWTIDEEVWLKQEFVNCEEIMTIWRSFFPRELSGQKAFDNDQSKYGVIPNQRSHFRLWCHVMELEHNA